MKHPAVFHRKMWRVSTFCEVLLELVMMVKQAVEDRGSQRLSPELPSLLDGLQHRLGTFSVVEELF